MTKSDPDKLCGECKKFDYDINRRNGPCPDIWVVCDHEENDKSFEPSTPYCEGIEKFEKDDIDSQMLEGAEPYENYTT
jgi:hypothetical protein